MRRKLAARRAGRIEALERRLHLSSATPALFQNDELVFQNYLPPRHSLSTPGGFLTSASRAKPLTIALSYVKSHAAALGLSPRDVATPFVTDQYTDSLTGLTHIYLEQEFNGLPVLNATLTVNVTRDGRLLNVAGGFVPGLGQRETVNPVISPRRAASGALTLAAARLGLKATGQIGVGAAGKGLDRLTALTLPSVSSDVIPAKLAYVPLSDGTVQLTWNMVLRTPDGEHWYDLAVGDQKGQIVFVNDWTEHASYNVIPRPTESPQDGPIPPNRSLATDPADPVASPRGWNDTNGLNGTGGTAYTVTIGNNVSAQEDADANNTGGFRPDGGASLNFDFPLDLTQSPTSYRSAAITNLFYWNNLLHDIHYHYGFNEVAGDFQTNNYGRGGTGGDAVQADAQDGSGTNNANFSSPPDGQAGRMQMYVFTSTNPNRDGDLDNQIVVHEYGHGVSNRLTGGPANANALNALQSGGMGEGWSDWWALMFTMKSTDVQGGAYPMGTYVLGQPANGAGIRRYPYSYDMSIDPLTINNFNTDSAHEVHNTGEIWSTTLWDLSWLLVDKYGFDPNIQSGFDPSAIKGNTLALQLIMDALKIQPANPSFKDARDAILQADVNLHASLGTPLNQNEIWDAFARRGMGASFVDASSAATSVTPAFDVPSPDPIVVSASATTQYQPVDVITFVFNQPMDTTSFDVASDVLSFTGPGNTNLKSTITNHTWLDSETLNLGLSPSASTIGNYTLVLGPNILAADDGHPMDQNRNGTPGENPADAYTLVFTYNPVVGPDGFGYRATRYAFENLDLVPGATGVSSILDTQDDSATSINLGTNSFNFYGTSYTGTNKLYVSTNGLITFGSTPSPNDYTNTDLHSSPTQRTIAPLWADWVTSINGAGAGNDVVLYKFQDTTGDSIPDRLIVEWSNVFAYTSQASAVTFQAILQLNTGTTPGSVIFNYPDLDAQDEAVTNGANATEGIKDQGTQGSNRLLLGFGSPGFPWVVSGSAVLFSPSPYPYVLNSSAPQTPSLGPLTSLDFTFSRPMDPTSFSVSDDVASFTGPGGSDLKPTISGFSWLDTATLRINFSPTMALGAYLMTIGPDIRSAGANDPMDQDLDGVPGEAPADAFTAKFTRSNGLGPDGFGYFAAPYPFQSLNLVAGAPGVVSILDGMDDGFTKINLASNSFNFYGTSYTGANDLYVSTNGLITFGSTDSPQDWNNTDLISSPSARTIAPMWDDWVTNHFSSGAANDVVLYAIQDTNGDSVPDQLVVQWNNVYPFDQTFSGVTFQTILQLNTGTAPGRIIFNYPDLDATVVTISNGASATIGIKDSGSQGSNRLLVSMNTGSFPWINSGKAVLIATDVSPPFVTTAQYQFQTGPAIKLTFSENVGSALSPADIDLQNLTSPPTPVSVANIVTGFDVASDTATITFQNYPGGILPDGNYRLTIHGNSLTDPAGNPLDGDLDGVAGGDYVFDFFVLAADGNRDRKVDIKDLRTLATHWQQSGATFDQGDFNYDGVVDNADLALLSRNWQVQLDPPPPSVATILQAASTSTATATRKATRVITLITPEESAL